MIPKGVDTLRLKAYNSNFHKAAVMPWISWANLYPFYLIDTEGKKAAQTFEDIYT